MARALIIRLDGASDGAICRVHGMTIVWNEMTVHVNMQSEIPL